MAQRQTQIKSALHTTVGGVNQRVQRTELKPHEYELLEGTYPQLAGLQAKIGGQRLLAKYDESVYGIHQFWTPYGYAVGLYTFTGILDIGDWTTPTSKFPLPDALPPSLPFDENMLTVDEFGNPPGEFPGINVQAPSVDPSNGAPAGQGEPSPSRPFVQPTDFVLVYTFADADFGCQGGGLVFRQWWDLIYYHATRLGPVVDTLRAVDMLEGSIITWYGATVRRDTSQNLGIISSGACPNTFPKAPEPYGWGGFSAATSIDRVYHIYGESCPGEFSGRISLQGYLIATGRVEFTLSIDGTVRQTFILQGGTALLPVAINFAMVQNITGPFSYTWKAAGGVVAGGSFGCQEENSTQELLSDIGQITVTGPFV